ncbi:DoxX family protein [Cellulomonas alba]|uniref:DoxX family protein n=1 Tax=Cellulomonas alba TaxID=3053467 RepID=A0ABT7SK23_9CELL|nr:DoxX family protein [Cellulomonas alba]MDM7856542.1 DoxX family protein [Cellulomonas alba]
MSAAVVSTPQVAAATGDAVLQDSIVTSVGARRALALSRLAVGFVFFWAFVDKLFGLHYATLPAKAWINGGQPSQGFLSHAPEGTGYFLGGFYRAIASPVSDALFMLGLAGIGLALILGMGVRIAGVTGALLMAFMWIAEAPWVAGAESNNPVVDYHVVYALVAVVTALTLAGDTWGLGKWWANLPVVKAHGWLR